MGRRAKSGERLPGARLAAALLAAWVGPVWLGCGAVQQTVVLVPSPDGRVGEVEVATSGGTQRLSKAGDMTSVSGAAPPAAVTTADPAWIAATFGEVMAAEPAPPETFILYFEAGTTTLDARSQSVVPAIVAAIARRGAIAVSISGHADATGSDELNDKLALERAERVKAVLLQQGVAPGPMAVTSHGKGNPAVPTPEGIAEPRNRRVEVTIQ